MRIVALLVGVLLASPARADELTVGGHGRLQVRYLRAATDAAPIVGQTDAGVAVRAMAGLAHLQLAVGLDVAFGGAHPAAFAYAAHLRPLGVAFDDGEGLRLSFTAGIGVDGAAPRVPAGLRLPVDFLLELPLVDGVKVELAGELAWLPTPEARRGGAELVEASDEDALAVRLRIDCRYGEWGAANGYFLALELGERQRATFIGVALGYGFDAATSL